MPIVNNNVLIQFVPDKYMYLTKVKKVEYKGINLKTDYLINIINELVVKYFFHKDDLIDKEICFNLWSTLLKKKYGEYYNYYMDYLVDNKFMFIVSNYFRCKKARTYKLNMENIIFIKKCKVTDNILIKKNSPEFLKQTFLEYNNSPIPLDIRSKLVDDLYKIKLDTKSSLLYLEDLKFKKDLPYAKYMKNYISVENIGLGNMFFKFDEYGRMHTNFTVLKKELRHKFLTIDNLPTDEIDIHNSQPLFLTVLMKKEMQPAKLFTKEVSRYIELVQSGLIYEELINKCGLESREDSKMLMYKVLFGTNSESKIENKMFYSLFPTVFDFIKEYKSANDNYKTLSHNLQLLESDFIYNKVTRHIMNSYPDITLFTIHDSISFQYIHKDKLNEIFKYFNSKIINM
jgi:hypothetical protein